MKRLRSKWLQGALGVLGIGGSLFFLVHWTDWSRLFWPGFGFIFALVGLVGLEMTTRALRVQKVVSLVSPAKKISFWELWWVGAVSDVAGAATPSSVGGEVSKLASFARFGVRGRDALMIIAMDRLVMLASLTVVLVVSAIPIVIVGGSALSLRSLMNTLALYAVLSAGLIAFLVVMVRRRSEVLPWKALLLRPSIFSLSMVHHLIRLGFLPFVLWVFARQTPTLEVLVWSFVLSYGISLLPVPSGGGSVEIAFMLLLKPLLGEDLASLCLVWWRFSSYYIYILMSIVVVAVGWTGKRGNHHYN